MYEMPNINVTVITEAQAISAGISPTVFRGSPGKSAIIGDNGNFWTYDDVNETYVDSGYSAQSAADSFEEIGNAELLALWHTYVS